MFYVRLLSTDEKKIHRERNEWFNFNETLLITCWYGNSHRSICKDSWFRIGWLFFSVQKKLPSRRLLLCVCVRKKLVEMRAKDELLQLLFGHSKYLWHIMARIQNKIKTSWQPEAACITNSNLINATSTKNVYVCVYDVCICWRFCSRFHFVRFLPHVFVHAAILDTSVDTWMCLYSYCLFVCLLKSNWFN